MQAPVTSATMQKRQHTMSDTLSLNGIGIKTKPYLLAELEVPLRAGDASHQELASRFFIRLKGRLQTHGIAFDPPSAAAPVGSMTFAARNPKKSWEAQLVMSQFAAGDQAIRLCLFVTTVTPTNRTGTPDNAQERVATLHSDWENIQDTLAAELVQTTDELTKELLAELAANLPNELPDELPGEHVVLSLHHPVLPAAPSDTD